ncbi:hypothetical protein [Candidatus Thiothrix anitrata]|uniref:Uncharacterized protein n=1 Tax=Candidatus Thiothrix anitrata TaxID=2823902 RepID=A0ABX7X0M5_9GAMM|nr:hypothetical protein [Candidatus Thiothrix anitrata]QTR48827.1 hypothetical protein J8380_11085 [Candidatus Thiothrix anitrata]
MNIAFLELAGGLPAAKPISVKVRGDDYAEIQAATNALKQSLAANAGSKTLLMMPARSAGNEPEIAPGCDSAGRYCAG